MAADASLTHKYGAAPSQPSGIGFTSLAINILLGKSLGTHRFQRAVSAKDPFIGTRPGYASPQGWGRLIPINRSLAETARWKRRVPRARFHSFMASQRDMSNSSEKCTANWPLCLVFSKGRIEGVKAKRPVCPALAPRFSFFQGVTDHLALFSPILWAAFCGCTLFGPSIHRIDSTIQAALACPGHIAHHWRASFPYLTMPMWLFLSLSSFGLLLENPSLRRSVSMSAGFPVRNFHPGLMPCILT